MNIAVYKTLAFPLLLYNRITIEIWQRDETDWSILSGLKEITIYYLFRLY